MPVGFAICGAVLPTLALDFGWRWAAASVGLLSIAAAIAMQPLRSLYDHERSGGPARLPTLAEVFEPLQLAWRDPILRPMCFIGMLFSATQAIVVNFTVVYAVDGLQMSYVLAGALLSAATVAGAFGRVFWGALADLLRRPSAVLAGIGAIVAMAAIANGLLDPAWPTTAVYVSAPSWAAPPWGWNGCSSTRAPRGRRRGAPPNSPVRRSSSSSAAPSCRRSCSAPCWPSRRLRGGLSATGRRRGDRVVLPRPGGAAPLLIHSSFSALSCQRRSSRCETRDSSR